MNTFLKAKTILILTLPLMFFILTPSPLNTVLAADGINVDPIIEVDGDIIPSYDDYVASQGGSSNTKGVLERMNSIAAMGGYKTGSGAATIPRIVGLVISTLLSLTGLIFIVLTVFAGFNWMTSQGNEEKIKKSQDTLKSSVIGLIITLSAWTIWNFIFTNLIL